MNVQSHLRGSSPSKSNDDLRTVTRMAVCLGLLGLGRSQPTRVTCPALHTRPAPHIRTAEASDGSREVRAIRENRDAGARDANPLSDVCGDHEFGLSIDSHRDAG